MQNMKLCLMFSILWLQDSMIVTTNCPNYAWGKNCENRCEPHCRRDCNDDTGRCNGCAPGYWGDNCNFLCPQNCQSSCYYFNTRLSYYRNADWRIHLCGSSCNQNSGTCQECQDDRLWGDFCNISCTTIDQNCDRCQISGKWCSVCNQAISNSSCISNCNQNCARCGSDGYCYHCLPGFWDNNCTKTCPENCLFCRKSTGACERCIDGHWGENCTEICSLNSCSHCNLRNGMCEICETGLWGPNCENKCFAGCADTRCERHTAACEACKHSYWGISCNLTCTIDNCESIIGCSKTKGPYCVMCKNGKWGYQCTKDCPKYCLHDCETISGECRNSSKYSLINPQATEESTIAQSNSAVSETTLETFSLLDVPLSYRIQTAASSSSILESSFATTETINTRIIPVSSSMQNIRKPSSNPLNQIPSDANLKLVLGLSIGSALVTSLIVTLAPYLFKSLFMSKKGQLSKVNKDISKGPKMSSVFALSDNAVKVTDDDSFTTTKAQKKVCIQEQNIYQAKDDSVKPVKDSRSNSRQRGVVNCLRKSVYHR